MFYDDIIDKVGNIRNRFQIFLFFLLTIRYLKIDSISILFMTLETNFKCDWVDTMTSIGLSFNESCGDFCRNHTEEKCLLQLNSSSIKCTKWKFENDLTIASEFNLVCDNKKWINLIRGSLWVGMVFGIILGPVADKFGRRFTIITANYIDILCAILFIFANGPWMLIILRFIMGILINESKISLINFQEQSNVSSRIIAGNCWWLMWVIGYCLMPLWAFIFPYWRHLQMTLVVLFSLVCLQPLFLPESPLWLLLRGRYSKAQQTMDWLCKMNRVPFVSLQNVKFQESSEVSLRKLVQHRGIIARIIFTLISWTCMSMLYYGITLDVKFAANNPYISTFIMGIAELPAIPIGIVLSNYLGYRIGLYILVSITSLLILVIPWIMDYFIPRAVISFIGKTCVTAAYSLVILYTGELYPTAIRNTGMSFNCLCKVSGMIIPYIYDLKEIHFYMPVVIFGTFGIILCLVIVPFPETRGAPLLQRVEDMPKLKWKIYKHSSACDVNTNNNQKNEIEIFADFKG